MVAKPNFAAVPKRSQPIGELKVSRHRPGARHTVWRADWVRVRPSAPKRQMGNPSVLLFCRFRTNDRTSRQGRQGFFGFGD